MKRSEMVGLINKKLIKSTEGYVNCNLNSFKEISDILLDELEYIGMLPPYNKNHGISNYEIAMGVSTECTHKWEPEDEG
jgi:hypothetical protein